jgi:membrane associated rhomboid family serine protease
MVVHWLCNFMLGQLFLPIVAAVGVSRVYCFFAVVCGLGAAFVSTFLVETKGKTPEEIGKLMQ